MQFTRDAHIDLILRKVLRVAAVASIAIFGVSLTACNTVEGVGDDIEAAGDGLSDAAGDAD